MCVYLCTHMCVHAPVSLFSFFNLQLFFPDCGFDSFLLDSFVCFEFFKSALQLLNVSCMFLLSPDFPDINLVIAEAETHYSLCFGVFL